jgi:hypothetical protein
VEKDTIYASELITNKIETTKSSIYNENKELKIEVYNDAFILPYKEPEIQTDDEKGDIKNRIGGVFDNNGNIIELSKTWAEKDVLLRVGLPDHYDTNIEMPFVNEEVVFIGYFMWHFGHFITEALCRLWVYLKQKELIKQKAVFISQISIDNPLISIVTMFGLDKQNIIKITEPTRFKTVIIPEQSYMIGEMFYHNIYNDIYKTIINNMKGYKYDKIYLSRSKFKDAPVYGEKAIEKIFKKNGFKIIYPEKISIYKQVRLMKNCKHLAGIAGSALHLSLFAKNNIECTTILRSDDVFRIQIYINSFKNNQSNYVEAGINMLPVLAFGGPFLIGQSQYLSNYFQDKKFRIKSYLCEGGGG